MKVFIITIINQISSNIKFGENLRFDVIGIFSSVHERNERCYVANASGLEY